MITGGCDTHLSLSLLNEAGVVIADTPEGLQVLTFKALKM